MIPLWPRREAWSSGESPWASEVLGFAPWARRVVRSCGDGQEAAWRSAEG